MGKKGSQRCTHPFHKYSKLIFLIDILRVEFQYFPVNTYQLDLVCFKDLQGSITPTQARRNFLEKKEALSFQVNHTYDFLKSSC